MVPWIAPLLIGALVVAGFSLLSAELADLEEQAISRGVLNAQQDAAIADLDSRLAEANDRLLEVTGAFPRG